MISFLVTTHNHGMFLKKCISSILNNDETFTGDVTAVLEQNGLHHSDVEKILNEIVLVAQNYFGEVS